MKKIYMILAVFALLSLSLNAQQLAEVKHSSNQELKSANFTSFDLNSLPSVKSLSLNDMLNRFNPTNMVKPQRANNGSEFPSIQFRAPKRLNSDETTVGPFTGDNFDDGLGFGAAYSSPQEIFIETDLLRSEYADYIGKDIIGFRLALYGDGSQTVNVGEFMAWPSNSDGSFDQDNMHTWSIGELTSPAGQPYDQYEKVTSTSDLESGAEYLIVYETGNVAFNGGLTTLDVGNNVISVTRNGTVIESNTTTDAATFTITANGNYYTIRSKSGYYIGRTSSSNGFNSSATTVYNNSITFSNNNVVIRGRSRTGNSATDTYYLRFNASSGTNNYRFRYYDQNSQQAIQLYKKVTVTPTAPAYVALQDGQWHEFYLDTPVPFNVGSDNAGLSLGYTYIQYPTGTTGQNLFPIAVNSQSTTHDHYAYMTVESQSGSAGDITISVSNAFNIDFYQIVVYDNDTDNPLTYWTSSGNTYTTSEGYTAYELPTGWSLSGANYLLQETVSGYNLAYLSVNAAASIVISNSALNGATNVRVELAAVGWSEDGQTITINGDTQSITYQSLAPYTWNPVDISASGTTTSTGWQQLDFSNYGDLAVQLIFKSDKTPAPTITGEVDPNNENNYVITATGNGTVTLTVGNQTVTGTGSASITIPRTDVDQTVTATATAQNGTMPESDPTTENFTVPKLQTAAPTISGQVDGDNYVITATGDGTVYLTVNGQTVSGQGSASITLPRQMSDYDVPVSAYAQESGKAASETVNQTETVPGKGNDGWIQMIGEYNDPDDLLSFQIKVGNDTIDIMMVDQFLASTYNNDHPAFYDYVMKETVNGEDKSSNTVDIPVYKHSSTLKGLFTKTQVDNDTKLECEANVVNTGIEYGVNPDHNTLYHSLYRGDKNAVYPAIDIPHRISQLQKYDEMDANENVYYFFKENETSGIEPLYDHVGNETVKRLDVDYVEGVAGDELAYVPVIWTFGLYTARGDGKNNSYGSDIKSNKLGGVNIEWIKGTLSTNNNVHQNDYGMWEAPNGTQYCVYTPWMLVNGIKPADWTAHDGDQYTFEPYMYRVWCIYPDARDFTRNSNGQLIDNGELGDTILLQTVYIDDPTVDRVYFGKEQWVESDGHLPYAIGVPVSIANDPSVLQFVVRFYYKRVLNEEVPGGTKGLRDGEEEEYYIVQGEGDGEDVTTGILEFYGGKAILDVTYVNAQGMKSSKPFDGVNIVVTRYSDGTTTTGKIVR